MAVPNVTPGTPVASTWGNLVAADLNAATTAIAAQGVKRYATQAARDAAWPAATAGDGAVSVTTDRGILWMVVAGAWQAMSGGAVWINAAQINGWNSTGLPTLQYRKLGDIVYLRGGIKGGTNGTVVFNLPVGYRPVTFTATLPTLVQGGLLGYMPINPNGDVQVFGANTNHEINALWAVTGW
jgi:hypothetical protein